MRIAMFTDIHFGARGNSQQHLDDCSNFIDWFIKNCETYEVDAVAFLGDWFESRESIMLHTLQSSHENASKLNKMGIPIYFITGNHDLRYKASREISSTVIFSEFDNFVVVQDEMVEVDLDGHPGVFCPFFFPDEYGINSAFLNNKKYVFGHFEFKGFVVTGKTVTLDHGPDHALIQKPKFVFSGHFHKRQQSENIVYVGNPFPTNYGDVMDVDRGMCILDTKTDKLKFLNFNGPSFYYSSLLDLVEHDVQFPPNSNVKCYVDVALSYSEIQDLRDAYMREFKLREFIIEDNFSAAEMARQDGVQGEVYEGTTKDIVEKIIVDKLEVVNSTIDKRKLIEIFNAL